MIFIDPKLWQVARGTPIGNVDVGDIIQLRENLVPVDYISSGYFSRNGCAYSYGIRPALILPSDFRI